jgi:integrase
VLAAWLTERAGRSDDPLFPGPHPPTEQRRDRAERQHPRSTAAITCPSLNGKHLHPHVLPDSCAMSLLQAGVGKTVIALWLGHANVHSTNAYIHTEGNCQMLSIRKVQNYQAATFSSVNPGSWLSWPVSRMPSSSFAQSSTSATSRGR